MRGGKLVKSAERDKIILNDDADFKIGEQRL